MVGWWDVGGLETGPVARVERKREGRRNKKMFGIGKRDTRLNGRGVGILGYGILAVVILILLIALFLVVGIVMLILGVAVIGGLLLAVFGPKPYSLFLGFGITIVAIILAVVTYLGSAGGLGF